MTAGWTDVSRVTDTDCSLGWSDSWPLRLLQWLACQFMTSFIWSVPARTRFRAVLLALSLAMSLGVGGGGVVFPVIASVPELCWMLLGGSLDK